MSFVRSSLFGAVCLFGVLLWNCQPGASERKILYYVNPMAPSLHSDKPMKDPMGMDYVPVYADQMDKKTADAAPSGGEPSDRAAVVIDARMQQLIGVKRDTVQKREMTRTLWFSGRVSHDADLYNLEEEYVAALRYYNLARGQGGQDGVAAAGIMLESARSKLLLAGLDAASIDRLGRAGAGDRSLLFSPAAGGGWIAASIGEADLRLIRPDQTVRIVSPAYPGKKFAGRIAGIEPVLDPILRAATVRIVSADLPRALSHESYVSVEITVSLGVRLAVSEDAVVDTGRRRVAFVITPDNKFEPRTVTLGEKADGYVEIIDGLTEGETVASAANFLIDSESQFQAALGKM